ncbi:hypothetical protein BAUCODRAFT_76289 [Baudoinia panamericana UAMH 10762]|uniref:Uncharacterized protein n=1 Tax=Baudoinia panamericana (strain UAMH 10762) TaxID=717646 RepID=M2MAF3_BAUPA|nr:uncharacterized protein BAUCODRAFT_76289 [Baudoinia panamericana UAMH 10762]EMC93451.1 hypothetical protein BAUCODRAFT_76289 [Baudoinia panamericana UAMH 10762]
MGDQSSYRPLPARAGTGLANNKPTRSNTDPSEAAQRPKRGHTHSRLHANTVTTRTSHNNHLHQNRNRARDTVQSAIELKPPVSFDHFLRRERKSPASSRRGSATQLQRDEDERKAQEQAQAEREVRRKVTATEVAQAKADNVRREDELRQTLKHVEELGMRSTRQLDDTYYAILEKASLLRSTVAGLQQLAEESKRMQKHFEEETRDLIATTHGSIEAFGDFQDQQRSIDLFVKKLNECKRETVQLDERLEQARQRTEAFDQRRKEKLATRRKQWTATWGAFVGVLVLVIAIVLLRNHRQVAESWDGAGQALSKVEGMAEDMLSYLPSRLRPAPSLGEDPYLRKLFDDL